MDRQSDRFLTFLLDMETYGIPIRKVKEIIGMMEVTHIPKTQNYVKGVINLRGKIIPIMDLRLKFGMEEKAYSERTCIIVVEVFIAEIQRFAGIVVDSVADVLKIQPNEIEPPPEYEADDDEEEFLIGIGKLKDKVVLILDIDKILNREEMVLFKRDLASIQVKEEKIVE